MKNRRNRLLSNGLFYIIVFVILLAGINWAVGGSGSNGSTENIRYSQLVKDLKAGKVKSINDFTFVFKSVEKLHLMGLPINTDFTKLKFIILII